MGFTGTVTRSRAGSHPLCRCAALRVTFDLRRVFALQKAGRETAAPVPHPIRTP